MVQGPSEEEEDKVNLRIKMPKRGQKTAKVIQKRIVINRTYLYPYSFAMISAGLVFDTRYIFSHTVMRVTRETMMKLVMTHWQLKSTL